MRITGEFYEALGNRDAGAFGYTTVTAIVRLVIIAVVVAIKLFIDGWLQLTVRNRMSKLLHIEYATDKRMYQVNAVAATRVENPYVLSVLVQQLN